MKRARRVIAFMLTIVMVLQSTVVAGANPDVFGNNFDNEFVGSNNGDANDTGDVDMTNGTGNNAELSDQQQLQEIFEDNSGEMNNPDQESQTDGAPVSQAMVSSDAVQSVLQYVNEDGSKDTYIRYQITLHNTGTAAAENLPVNIVLPSTLTYAVYPGRTDETAGIDTGSGVEIGGTVYDRAISWMNQTLAAGASAEYVVYTLAQKDITDAASLTASIYVDGTQTAASWENESLLADNVMPTPEPEETKAPEPTETPEVTETPEPTETPEVTPEPTEAPKIEDVLEENKEQQQSSKKLMSRVPRKVQAKALAEEAAEENTSNKLQDYNLAVQIETADGVGEEGKYNPNDVLVNNGHVKMRLDFAESERYQFPVYDGTNEETQKATTLTYQMPKGLKGFDPVVDAPIINTSTKEKYGTYNISADGQLTIKFNKNVQNSQSCKAFIEFWAKFDRDVIQGQDQYIFEFEGTTGITVKFKQGESLTARKTAGEYNAEDGTFTFTIELEADAAITGVEIQDTLGSSLAFVKDSAQLDGKLIDMTLVENNTYLVSIGDLAKGNHILTYQAAIKPEILKNTTGTFTGLDNTAVIQSDGNSKITVRDDAEYSHDWLKKNNSGGVDENNKIAWTITLNPGGQQDVSGMTIHDRLLNGVNYDTSTPITVVKKPLVGEEVTKQLEWSKVTMDNSGKGWSYTLLPSEAGKAEYKFTYYTTVESGFTGTAENQVTVDDKFPTLSEVTIDGSGSGTGEGDDNGIKKIYVETVSVDGKKYVKWQATLTVNEKRDSVKYTDTLYGTHGFETPLSVNNAGAGYSNIEVKSGKEFVNAESIQVTSNNKSFVLDFGAVEGSKTFDITYYSKVETNGTLSNVGILTTDGKTTSDSAGTTVMDGNFSKEGINNNNGEITWRIYLNKQGSEFPTKTITIEDSFSENQTYVEGSAKLIEYGEDTIDLSNPSYNQERNVWVFTVPIRKTRNEIYLEYKTKVNTADQTNDIECTNKAIIKDKDQVLGTVDDTVTIPNKLFDKSLIQDPGENAQYEAKFELIVNEANKKIGDAEDYVISDHAKSNMKILQGSIKVEQKQGSTWTEIGKKETSEPYFIVNGADNEATITIKNAQTIEGRYTYRITYDATVTPPQDASEEWSNQATFKAGTVKKESSVDGTVTKDQGTTSGILDLLSNIKISKISYGNGAKLQGAVFTLYEINENGDINPVSHKGKNVTATTDENGEAILGEIKGDTSSYPLKKGVKYVLKETTVPSGYQKAEDIKFQILSDTNVGSEHTVYSYGQKMEIKNMPLTSVAVKKEWNDGDNQDGTRPNSVTVNLLANGTPVSGKTLTLSGTNGWSDEWTKLPVYNEDGTRINYTVKEEAVKGYKSETGEVTETTVDGTDIKTYSYTITNSYTPGKVSVDVKKKWEDGENRDGIRPKSIQVTLYKKVDSGSKAEVEKQTLNAANNWYYKWTGLPEKENGAKITYTVEETVENNPDYTLGTPVRVNAETDKDFRYEITNSYIPAKTNITLEKQWSGENGYTGNRPVKITVALYKTVDNVTSEIEQKEITASGSWTYTWKDLPVNEKGKKITYSAKEIGTISDYEPASQNAVVAVGGTITLVNAYKPEETERTVVKKWEDNNNAGNSRPNSITATLQVKQETGWVHAGTIISALGEGKDTVTLNNGNNWTYTWEKLPKRLNGTDAQYQIVESGYDSEKYQAIKEESKDVTTFTNVLQVTSASVQKIWADDDNKANKRPESVKVQLRKKIGNANAIDSGNPVELNERNKWYYQWTDLPAIEGNDIVTYSVEEVASTIPAGYTHKVAASEDKTNSTTQYAYTITNTYEAEKTSITAKKVWDDNDNQDGKRWDRVTLTLLADDEQVEAVTLTKNNVKSDNPNVWTYTWNNLEKYKAGAVGQEIKYTVKETTPEDVKGYNKPAYSQDGNVLTVTNSYIPKKTSIKVKKIWEDNGNNDGKRPETLKVNLLKNSENYKEATLEGESWEYTWENLPVYENGKKITYTVTEDYVGKTWERFYERTIPDKPTMEDNVWTFTLTNTHTDETVDKTVTKIWEDEDNQDVVRPYAIVVRLYQQIAGEAEAAYTGTGAKQVLSGKKGWTYTWTNLPKYSDGKEITYTVKEIGYQMTADAEQEDGKIPKYNDPEYSNSKEKCTITNRRKTAEVSAKVTKVWEDNKNHDGKRPKSITLQLMQYADGVEKSVYGNPVTINEEDGWTYEWHNLPKYRNNDGDRQTWQYTVEEAAITDSDYEANVVPTSTDKNFEFEFTLTNTHADEKVNIDVTKNWQDNSNQDGIRPKSIYLQLYRTPEDGDIEAVGDPVQIQDSANVWSYQWENQDKYQDGGALYTYTVAEGQLTEGTFVPFTEKSLEGYKAEMFAPTVDKDGNTKITITNTHETDEISINMIKSWIEDDPESRPAEVKFYLMQTVTGEDGGKVTSQVEGIKNPVTLTREDFNDADKWIYTWKDLPKKHNGEDILYTIAENIGENDPELGYVLDQSTKNGLIEATNTNVEKKSISVEKIWNDQNNAAAVRPKEITVVLWADGRAKDIVTLSGASTLVNPWSYTWTDLPVYTRDENGEKKEIDYEVTEGFEAAARGYETPVIEETTTDGSKDQKFTITNTYNAVVSKTVTKVWDDNRNQDGKRFELYMGLYADDELYTINDEPAVVKVDTEEDAWTYTWTDLPKYNDLNTEIVYSAKELKKTDKGYEPYTAEELEALGYTAIVDANDPMKITNKHAVDDTEVKVTKIWDDDDNVDGFREKITANLLANGQVIDSTVLSDENEWTHTWEKLPLKENGEFVVYTVEEVLSQSLTEHYDSQKTRVSYPAGFMENLSEVTETIQDGTGTAGGIWEFKLTNTYKKEYLTKSVKKVWTDNDDQDQIRPAEIKVRLMKNGVICSRKDAEVTLNEANNWSYEWKELPKRWKQTMIHYTVEEVAVPEGYEVSYTETETGFVVENRHETEKTGFSIVKQWVDNNNPNRPKEVQFQLYAKKYSKADDKWTEEKVGEAVKFGGTGNTWEYQWKNLPVKNDGKDIQYRAEEVGVPSGYVVSYENKASYVVATNTTTTTEFSKKALTGTNELAGAVLRVTDLNGRTVIAPWTSGNIPRIIQGTLVPGQTYILEELSAPAGYAIAAPQRFTVNTDGTIQRVTMLDDRTEASILKVDSETKKALAGATLAIKDRLGNIVEQWVSTESAHILTGKLSVGQTYTLTELEAPLGYFKAQDQTFVVPANGKITVTMEDKPEEAKGRITATKRVTAVNDDFEFVAQPVAEDVTFYMALFKDAAGKERYTEYAVKSVVVRKDTSISEPAVWENLPSGTYYVFETDASGKAIALNEAQTETDASGKEYSYTCVLAEGTQTNAVELAMQQQKREGAVNLENAYLDLPDGFYYSGELSINKRVLKNGAVYDTNEIFYAGIYTRDENGDYQLFDTVTLNNNGTVTVEVPLGGEDGTEPITYYVMECDEAGIPVDEDTFAYEVTVDGTAAVSQENPNAEVTITNRQKDNVTEMQIMKVDEAGRGLAGAAFMLTYHEGNVTAGRWTSTPVSRKITLIPGTYTLSELAAPAGYTKGSDATITVSENGEIRVSGSDISYSNGVARYVNRKGGSITPTTTSGGSTRTATNASYTVGGKTAVNTIASNAKTGDDTPIAVYVILLGAAVVLGGIVLFRRRRKDTENETK